MIAKRMERSLIVPLQGEFLNYSITRTGQEFNAILTHSRKELVQISSP